MIYEVQRLIGDGKVVDVRPKGDKLRPYSPGDRSGIFEVVERDLTDEQAEALFKISMVGGGDGYAKDMDTIAKEGELAAAPVALLMAEFTRREGIKLLSNTELVAECQRRGLVVKAGQI